MEQLFFFSFSNVLSTYLLNKLLNKKYVAHFEFTRLKSKKNLFLVNVDPYWDNTRTNYLNDCTLYCS